MVITKERDIKRNMYDI